MSFTESLANEKRARDEEDDMAPDVPEPMQTTASDDYTWNPLEPVTFAIELNRGRTIQVEMDIHAFTPGSDIKISGREGTVVMPLDVALYSVLLMMNTVNAEHGTFGVRPRFVASFFGNQFRKLKNLITGDQSTPCKDLVSMGIVIIMLVTAGTYAAAVVDAVLNNNLKDLFFQYVKFENLKTELKQFLILNAPGSELVKRIVEYHRRANRQTLEASATREAPTDATADDKNALLQDKADVTSTISNSNTAWEAWEVSRELGFVKWLGDKTAELFPRWFTSENAPLLVGASQLYENLTQNVPWTVCRQIFQTIQMDNARAVAAQAVSTGPATAFAQYTLNLMGRTLFRGAHGLICWPLGLSRKSARYRAQAAPPAPAPPPPPRVRFFKLRQRDDNGDESDKWSVYDNKAAKFLTGQELSIVIGKRVLGYPIRHVERIDAIVRELNDQYLSRA